MFNKNFNMNVSRNKMTNSMFIKNFDMNASQIKEIISTPCNVKNYLENLKIIHNSIENMIEQYQQTGINAIKKELYDLGVKLSEIYKTTIKNDILNHEPCLSYTLPEFKEPKINIELYSDDIYDNLFMYVDENINVNSDEGRKTIAKFYIKQKEINDLLDQTRENILKFEQFLVNFKAIELETINNIVLPTLYKAHMSYIKLINKNNVLINLKPETTTIVSGKQTVFIPKSLKKWLNLE